MKHSVIITALSLLSGGAVAQTTYKIVDTAQQRFFDNYTSISKPKVGERFYGQDAHHTGNQPNYTDNGDGTITDNVTGLVWQKEFKVISYAEAIELAKNSRLGGYQDWRLPSIKEAYSLIMFSGTDVSSQNMSDVPSGATPFIDTNYFDFAYGANGTRAIDSQMLSTTLSTGASTPRQQFIFGVNLADGRIKSYPIVSRGADKKYMVRLVRGAEYGINNLCDNGDGTISDSATGLMWQKGDSRGGLNWESALNYATLMNQRNYLGHNDWRLPNAKELQSIVEYSRSPNATNSAAIDPIFEISEIRNEAKQIDYPFFWSSTTHRLANGRREGGAAVYVCFGRGLGNMQQGQGQRQGQGQGQQQRQGQGQQQQRQGQQRYQQGNRPQQQTNNAPTNWIDIHGAGAQRSDPKEGDASHYANGRGPQGDAIRIENYVRLVRDIK